MRNDKEASACPQAALLLREEGEGEGHDCPQAALPLREEGEGEGEVTRGEETMGNACPQAALKLAETFANVVYIHVSKFMDMYANVMWKLMYRNCCRRTIY
jgi:hypothetical protein